MPVLRCRLPVYDPAAAEQLVRGQPGVLETRPTRGALLVHYDPRQIRCRELRRLLEPAPARSLLQRLRDRGLACMEQNLLEEATQAPDWDAALRVAYLQLHLLRPSPRPRHDPGLRRHRHKARPAMVEKAAVVPGPRPASP